LKACIHENEKSRPKGIKYFLKSNAEGSPLLHEMNYKSGSCIAALRYSDFIIDLYSLTLLKAACYTFVRY